MSDGRMPPTTSWWLTSSYSAVFATLSGSSRAPSPPTSSNDGWISSVRPREPVERRLARLADDELPQLPALLAVPAAADPAVLELVDPVRGARRRTSTAISASISGPFRPSRASFASSRSPPRTPKKPPSSASRTSSSASSTASWSTVSVDGVARRRSPCRRRRCRSPGRRRSASAGRPWRRPRRRRRRTSSGRRAPAACPPACRRSAPRSRSWCAIGRPRPGRDAARRPRDDHEDDRRRTPRSRRRAPARRTVRSSSRSDRLGPAAARAVPAGPARAQTDPGPDTPRGPPANR